MYWANSKVRFWEQEGQSWKTLQLKGRKYSARQSGLEHWMRATPFV